MKPKSRKKPIPGWQTMQQAAIQSGYTRQRIYQMAFGEGTVDHNVILGRPLVRDPFPVRKGRK